MTGLYSPVGSYLETLRNLLDHQGEFLAELALNLEFEIDPKLHSEHEYYRHLWTAVGNFHKFASQNLTLANLAPALAKVRVCMMLNQYVLSNEKVRDAIGLARQRCLISSNQTLSSAVIHRMVQLKCDLVAVKAVLANADDFEHFATGMALIKVNHLLTTDIESLQPHDDLFHYSDMALASPNETRITATKLRKPTDLLVNIQLFSWWQSQIARYLCALELLHSAVSTLDHHQQEIALLWWQVLGNNDYDYGVRCYLHKCEEWHKRFGIMRHKLERSIHRWQQMERAVGKLDRQLRRRLGRSNTGRIFSPHLSNGAINRNLAISKHSGVDDAETFASDDTNVTPIPPVQYVGGVARAIDQFRNLLLRYAQMELQACVRAVCELLAEVATASGGSPSERRFSFAEYDGNRPRQKGFADIVREYNATMDFTTRLMEAPPGCD